MTDEEKIIKILEKELSWEEDLLGGNGEFAVITKRKLKELVTLLIDRGIGDCSTLASIWLEYSNKLEYHKDVAEQAFKELCIDKIFGVDTPSGIQWMWDFYKARAEKKLAKKNNN